MNKSTVNNNNNNNNSSSNNQSVLNSNQKLLQKERIPTISFKASNYEKRVFVKAQSYRFLINRFRQLNKRDIN